MFNYIVYWTDKGKGSYLPPDPGSLGGDYYSDIKGTDIIMAKSKKQAREIIKQSRPSVTIREIKRVK